MFEVFGSLGRTGKDVCTSGTLPVGSGKLYLYGT